MFLGLMRVRGMESNATSGYAEAFHTRKNNSRRWKVKATAPESLGQAKDKPMVPKDFSHSRELQPKAHRLIPGGAHTYAKGDDQFPEQAPGFIRSWQRLPLLGCGRE